MASLTLSNGTTVDPSSLDSSPPDPGVVKLAHTIKGLEGGDYNNRSGDSGSSAGAYQWNNDNKPLKPGELPSHWKNAAAQYLKDSNAPMTPENQNYVAYQQIKAYKDQGKSPEEIDALWNGAKKDSSGKYVHLSSERQAKFRAAILGGDSKPTTYNPKPYSNPSPGQFDFTGGDNASADKGPTTELGGELSNRLTDIGGAASVGGKGLVDISKGNVLGGAGHVASGLVQGAGAVAGGVSDVIGAGLKLIPGVKQGEDLLGKGVGAVANTDTGKKIVGGIQDWSDKNPEIAKDIGAAGNIAGLVGGGGAGKFVKDAAKEGIYSAAKSGLLGTAASGMVEKRALSDAADILGSKATKGEVKSAVRRGDINVKGGVPGLVADTQKESSIKEVSNLIKDGKVSKNKLASENAKEIKNAADQSAEDMRSKLKTQEVTPIAQPEDLMAMGKKVLDRAGSSVTSGENPANKLLKVFSDSLPKGGDITAENILDARQALSKYVLENSRDWSMKGVLTGFKSARNAIWDESRNLLADMAPNVPVKEMLAKQTALYKALDYIVPNVQKELGTTRFGRFTQRHPHITGLVRGAARYGTMGAGFKGAESLIP